MHPYVTEKCFLLKAREQMLRDTTVELCGKGYNQTKRKETLENFTVSKSSIINFVTRHSLRAMSLSGEDDTFLSQHIARGIAGLNGKVSTSFANIMVNPVKTVLQASTAKNTYSGNVLHSTDVPKSGNEKLKYCYWNIHMQLLNEVTYASTRCEHWIRLSFRKDG